MHYYTAIQRGDEWLGRVYKWDSTGNQEIAVWTSNESYPTKEAAEDSAATWCDQQHLESELG